jgi:hypothetical protein
MAKYSKFGIIIFRGPFLVLLISILVILSVLFLINFSDKNTTDIQNLNNEVNCKCSADTLNFVKQKLKKLLSDAHQTKRSTREKEVLCINNLIKNSEFLIMESTEAGDNYHKLDQYNSKEISRIFYLDTIVISAFKDRISFKIMGKSKDIKLSIDKVKTEKVIKRTIPTTFQGKIKGNIRRINIINQITDGDIVEFSYSILGSHTDKNKKGKVDFKKLEAEFETIGKAKIYTTKDNINFKFELPDTEVHSLN